MEKHIFASMEPRHNLSHQNDADPQMDQIVQEMHQGIGINRPPLDPVMDKLVSAFHRDMDAMFTS
jgi:hypothetical protein